MDSSTIECKGTTDTSAAHSNYLTELPASDRGEGKKINSVELKEQLKDAQVKERKSLF